MSGKHFDLEDRLVAFGARVIDVVEALPRNRAGNYIAGQLIRCGLAPALNYGEAQGAESKEDFIHKMKIIVKELKETRVCIKLIRNKAMIKPVSRLDDLSKENEELIAIISKGIVTAQTSLKSKK